MPKRNLRNYQRAILSNKNKPKIFNDKLLDQLMKLPDLFFAEDMETMSKAKLVLVMEGLDEASDFINDYLTESNYQVNHCYPDISDKKH